MIDVKAHSDKTIDNIDFYTFFLNFHSLDLSPLKVNEWFKYECFLVDHLAQEQK